MADKLTGYKVFVSSGGNTCLGCGTRMRKGLPYIAPISGKRVIREKTGKSICITCISELTEKMDVIAEASELEIYERRRFLEHMDKEDTDV
ncbi:MAG: hypothetical protein GY861_29240 [bacterium]|nr:hypothetical protein [bacterium]